MTITKCRALVILMVASAMTSVAYGAEAESASPQAAAEAIPADPGQLRALVAGLDREMFDAYNAHDVGRLMAMFADDLEFYHDTSGLLNHEQVTAGFTSVFANNKDIRRELIEGSLEAYPIKDYGAIQIAAHRFCHTENGKEDCGTFRFMQVWRFRDGVWQVSRDVSYGH